MRISIDEAVTLLQHGEVVAIPTETVYGLAASLFSLSAIEKVFSLKGRPRSNPLILHVKDKEECLSYLTAIPPHFHELTSLWPGPLTLILPVDQSRIPSIARANLSTCGFRVPEHPVAQELLEKISPLVAPSANISGRPSATRYQHIEHDFGINFPVIEAEVPKLGVESTILAFVENKWQIARLGALSKERLAEVLGYLPEEYKKRETPICPGQLFRHYAPKCRLLLSLHPEGEYIVGYRDRSYAGCKKLFCLGSSNNAEEVAFSLYDILRRLDQEEISEAVVDMRLCETLQPGNLGLWATIIERLSRAANQ
jgi:L-threonylcarbamoyladenylate synthase